MSGGEPQPTPSARFALRFPAAREDHPFGPDAHVFKVGGGSTMFAILGDGPPVTVTLKLTREEREVALVLPFVIRGPLRRPLRLGDRQHRGRARARGGVCEWMRESYWLKAPKDLRESAWPSPRLGLPGPSPPVSQPTRQYGESSSATRSRNSLVGRRRRRPARRSRCRSRQRRCLVAHGHDDLRAGRQEAGEVAGVGVDVVDDLGARRWPPRRRIRPGRPGSARARSPRARARGRAPGRAPRRSRCPTHE